MFNSLCGTITSKQPQSMYLETSGIEWDIAVPDSALDVFPPVGSEARVYTWLLHREDTMKIFGFPTPQDRALFLDLLKVDGVGNRGALKIMSHISPQQLSEALDSEDLSTLEKLPGVGKKTAQKMMLTLKGKLAFSSGTAPAVPVRDASPWQDVITALVDMGYEKRSCEEVVHRLEQILSQEFQGKSRAKQEELMFSRAIVELA
ncbi:MAG: Holliday junction branch migration protein RuvA [Candidatus Treponema excrementipullorum]|nr:Holliday junction branch migration protein RuvA [Spirochaetia bacterium]MCI7589603.1 Holliday junction branch migration protein RuvA [Spirochaetia bacterium]MDD7012935.1 Holliday junction branch migration protein RuvA [Candidatus Treponema excrementipullorum]MDY4706908.1 Holliday junction branch migration protein RuvA [Candidatus Treponema excrementipullorum]